MLDGETAKRECVWSVSGKLECCARRLVVRGMFLNGNTRGMLVFGMLSGWSTDRITRVKVGEEVVGLA